MRKWVFTIAATLSFVLCITFLLLWNSSWEDPGSTLRLVRRWKVGPVEITDVANHLSLGLPTQKELGYRDWYVGQQQAILFSTTRRPVLQAAVNSMPLGSPARRQAQDTLDRETRYNEAWNRPLQSKPIVERELAANLPLLTALTAILPLVWIRMLWRRKRDAVRSAWSRRIRWKRPEELTRGQRLLRGSFAAVSAASLLLSLAAAFLWGRSYLSSDQRLSMQFVSGPGMPVRIVQWSTHRGGVVVGWRDNLTIGAPVVQPPGMNAVDWIEWQFDREHPRPPRFHKLPPERVLGKAVYSYGFHYQQFPGNSGFMWVMPFWFPMLLFALTPAVWLLIHWKRKQKAGHCPTCGYNLTGNLSGLCPECGTALKLEPESMLR